MAHLIGALGDVELLIVPEPSSNLPIIAHKGSVQLRITATGKTAHPSMPEFGDNAVSKITDWVKRIEALTFDDHSHPLLGETTACVTTISGGQNINLVAEPASFTVDFRHASGIYSELIERMCYRQET